MFPHSLSCLSRHGSSLSNLHPATDSTHFFGLQDETFRRRGTKAEQKARKKKRKAAKQAAGEHDNEDDDDEGGPVSYKNVPPPPSVMNVPAASFTSNVPVKPSPANALQQALAAAAKINAKLGVPTPVQPPASNRFSLSSIQPTSSGQSQYPGAYPSSSSSSSSSSYSLPNNLTFSLPNNSARPPAPSGVKASPYSWGSADLDTYTGGRGRGRGSGGAASSYGGGGGGGGKKSKVDSQTAKQVLCLFALHLTVLLSQLLRYTSCLYRLLELVVP